MPSVLQLADHRVLGEVSGELSPASVYVGLLPVGEACVVAAGWSRPGFELINDYAGAVRL